METAVGGLRLQHPYGPVAQLGERCVRNAEAEGSNPFGSTTEKDSIRWVLFLIQAERRPP